MQVSEVPFSVDQMTPGSLVSHEFMTSSLEEFSRDFLRVSYQSTLSHTEATRAIMEMNPTMAASEKGHGFGGVFKMPSNDGVQAVVGVFAARLTNSTNFQFWVSGEMEDIQARVLPRLAEIFPEEGKETIEEDKVLVRFWTAGSYGPIPTSREVEFNTWDDISMNYPKSIRGSLEDLMGRSAPDSGGKLILWHGPPGGGKGLPLEARICTPDGWRTMGELEVGDFVVGSDGDPVEVTEIFDRGIQPLYRVVFSDGAETICDGDHLWGVREADPVATTENLSVMSTEELASGADASGSLVEDGEFRWFVPLPFPVQYGGVPLREIPYQVGLQFTENSSFEHLLISDEAQRKALLAGLLDGRPAKTDEGLPLFETSSLEVAEDVISLVRSLGGVASLVVEVNQEPTPTAYGVVIELAFNPYFSERGRSLGTLTRAPFRAISSIEEVGHGETRCIKVDAPDELFVIDDYVVTHNTNAIQALLKEWEPWCDVDYIVDPENFLGDPNYLIQTLTYVPHSVNFNELSALDPMDSKVAVEDALEEAAERWRLIVVEDATRFVRSDADAKSGQAFGRLLNVTDGLLGQGLKVMVLITTNEPIKELHPALQRPGRCLADVEFSPFPASEASEWLGYPVREEKMLAELFAMGEEFSGSLTSKSQSIGLYL
jgi:hypothetical protein